jgi:acetoacetyl-CoA synthetase
VTSPESVLWRPSAPSDRETVIGRYVSWLGEERGLTVAGYDQLWQWSVSDLEGFWGSIWDFFEVRAGTPYERVMGPRQMPGTSWFPGARLNYAEHIVGDAVDLGRSAVVAHSQTREPVEMTYRELRDQVAMARVGLQRLGVVAGDRVAAYLPNIPETLVVFLATVSLGAIWTACAPELGPRSVIDRLGPLEPKVLLAIGGYRYGERMIDRRGEVAEVRAAIGSFDHVVHVPYMGGDDDWLPDAIPWSSLLAESGPMDFEAVPFDHPLCVLFSSGTTGPPKAIVHGHGGILLEHLKNHGLSWDLRPGDRMMWFSTTSWMMWNSLVSALLLGASIVMIDGNPAFPGLDYQWRLAEETRPTILGMSPTLLMACRDAGITVADLDLASIRQLGAAGSPLPAEGFDWVYEQMSADVLLNLGSGGTDLCTGIVQGSPLQPVYRGEISGACLGVDAAAFDAQGRLVIGELGELVIRSPMPSMPIGFWNDDDGSRYRGTYFGQFPGVWRHGDWVAFAERGSCVIAGRSDATLNRGGVRLGTGEFYRVVERDQEVKDSLVVHLDDPRGGGGDLILFVELTDGAELDDALRKRLAASLRRELSPRHVPDLVRAVPTIPRTLNGKKLELPVKRILLGEEVADVVRRDALADPTAMQPFIELAGTLIRR